MDVREIMAASPYLEVAIRNLYWRSPVLPKLAAWYAAKPRMVRGAAGHASPSTSIKKVVSAMREWGVQEGDLLLVHSGFRALRADGASPDDIVDELLGVVGPSGTLVLPAIPNWPEAPQLYERMVVDVADLVLDYDPRGTPSWTGAVPNAMVRRSEAIRSPHPLNSVVAIGPLAKQMMEGNLAGDRPFACGPTSAWNFLYENHCKVVAMGADLAHSLTMIHLAEDLLGEDWPVSGWYRDRRFRVKVDGQWEPHVVRERHPKWAMFYGERTLSRDLLRKGLAHRCKTEGVNVEMISGRELINYLNTRNHDCYPYFLIPKRYRKTAYRKAASPVGRLRRLSSLPGYTAVCADPRHVLLSKGRGLYLHTPLQGPPRRVCTLPPDQNWLTSTASGMGRWFRRMARTNDKVGVQLGEGRYLVANREAIFAVETNTGRAEPVRRLRDGWRPLQFSRIEGVNGFDNSVCYGEYAGDNLARRAVSVWRSQDGGREWSEAYRFPAGEVEHVHGLVGDPYRGCVWILTGDYDKAAGIWMANENFSSVAPVSRGAQIFRACVGFPVPEGLLYATDSHLSPNSIRLLHEQGGKWCSTPLHPLRGPCVYGSTVGDHFAFSTVVEPPHAFRSRLVNLLDPRVGPGVAGRTAELVLGNMSRGFGTVLEGKADALPKGLFGFSTIRLPAVSGQVQTVVATGAGLRDRDEVTEFFALDAGGSTGDQPTN